MRFAYAKTKAQTITAQLISDCVIFLDPKFQVSYHLLWLKARFVLDLVGTHENRVSRDAAQMILKIDITAFEIRGKVNNFSEST